MMLINNMKKLVKLLNEATEAYDRGEPIMTDKEWDEYYFKLKQMEEQLDYCLPESPTQSISYTVVNELTKVKHNHEMLSLPKTKELNEVESFLHGKDFLAMAKMDGLTCSLLYENGKLVSAETRGDGIIGEDITHNAMVIKSIPKEIPYYNRMVIDGEIICKEDDFEQFKGEYKNPRNFAAGSIRLLDSRECAKRNLTFVAWDVIEGLENETNELFIKLGYLIEWNFIVVPHVGPRPNSPINDHISLVKQGCSIHHYPIDGIVFKFNDIKYGKSLGKTAHHFNNAIAYKFYDETYKTYIKDIEWTMGRTGVLTPVAVFEPIEIDGATVERASLHNVSVMESILGMFPYYNQQIEVFKANMIIPQIKSAIPFNNVQLKDDEIIFSIPEPTTCPVCGGEVKIQTSEAGIKNLMCINPQCKGKLINRLDHFCSKKGLDIKGLSKATLEKLIDWGYVNDLDDLFNLDMVRDVWVKRPGFGEKSVNKIISAVYEASQHASLEAIISAAGIPLIGRTVAKDLAKRFKTYENFRKHINEGFDFTQIDGYGPEMTKALLTFNYGEIDFIVGSYMTIAENKEESIEVSNSLEGKTFVITGKLKQFKNRDALKAEIEARGGKVSGSVTKKTDYLINNDTESTTAKNKTAKELGVPIISEENFIKIFDF